MSAPLPFGLTVEVLSAAESEPDPGSLAALSRLRSVWGPDLAGAAATQVTLRRRAVPKFGPQAATMFFTRDGLEQATRPAVAAHHANRFRDSGAIEVIDLGCGIGGDAAAFADAGLRVLAVDVDPDTVAVAQSNLARWPGVEVRQADATAERARLGDVLGRGWFVDPARRNGAGRVWRVEEFQPPWSLVTDLLHEPRVCGVKLGPGLPHALIPEGVEAEWVTHRGETVEVVLWSAGTAQAGMRRATVLEGDGSVAATLTVSGVGPGPSLPVVDPLRFLIEPVGAVIRAGGVRQLGAGFGAAQLDPAIAYLTADQAPATRLAAVFAVQEVLPYKPAVLKSWLLQHDASAVEIKKRGVEVDPAQLRRRILPHPVRGGDPGWTFIITPTLRGVVVLAGRRMTTS